MVPCTFFILLLYCSIMGNTEAAVAKRKDCVLDKDKDFPDNPPVILRTPSTTPEIVHQVNENGEKIIRIGSGSHVAMSCHGRIRSTTNSFKKLSGHQQDIIVECEEGKLNIEGQVNEVKMKDLECNQRTKGEIITSTTNEKCNGVSGEIFKIGFYSKDKAKRDIFYPQIRVCFAYDEGNNSNETTYWTEHILYGPSLDVKDGYDTPDDDEDEEAPKKGKRPQKPPHRRSKSRPEWNTDIKMFTPKIEYIYTTKSQKNRFKNLIVFPGDKYFARGHLSPAADFITHAEQDVTHQFSNALPQWQQINNGNWKAIEESIRNLANKRKLELKVLTGGYGIWKLKGSDIYLGDSDQFTKNQKKVPIPEFTWKIVVDNKSGNSTAFIVSNDPFSQNKPAFGSSIQCSTLKWLKELKDEKEKGYAFCFSYPGFLVQFPSIARTLPIINPISNDLLTK